MDSISKKASYIKGLFEGLQIDENQKEGKIIKHILVLLEDIVDELEDIKISQYELHEYMDYIDDDLGNLEEYIYDEEEDLEEEPGYIEVECPNCDEIVYFDEDSLKADEELLCPNCHQPVYIDYDDEQEDIEE
ncbi:MAG: hypothetical protein PHP06_01350 [Clostridia bacterium]|nr:hypothetical protein [Clostridia bacterium]